MLPYGGWVGWGGWGVLWRGSRPGFGSSPGGDIAVVVAWGTPKLDCADGLGVLVKAGKMP
ncbi:hypothetical protein GCM10009565_73670 [Amycolatopsis albidoflavus]